MSLSRVLLVLMLLLSLVSVYWAIDRAGDRGTNRKISADLKRLDDLNHLAVIINEYALVNQMLPADLKLIQPLIHKHGLPTDLKLDPHTRLPYNYRILGQKSFELCTVFDLSSDAAPTRIVPKVNIRGLKNRPDLPVISNHPQGPACFNYSVDTSPEIALPTR